MRYYAITDADTIEKHLPDYCNLIPAEPNPFDIERYGLQKIMKRVPIYFTEDLAITAQGRKNEPNKEYILWEVMTAINATNVEDVIYKPTTIQCPASVVTNELWCTEPIAVRYCGRAILQETTMSCMSFPYRKDDTLVTECLDLWRWGWVNVRVH